MVASMVGCFVGWFDGLLVGYCLGCWLPACLVAWFGGLYMLVAGLVFVAGYTGLDCFVGWLLGWLVGCLVVVGWLFDFIEFASLKLQMKVIQGKASTT